MGLDCNNEKEDNSKTSAKNGVENKKQYYIGRWIAVAGFIYLSLIALIFSLFVDKAAYMRWYIIIFAMCAAIVSPPLIRIKKHNKLLSVVVAGIVITAIVLMVFPVTIWNILGHFIALIYIAYYIIRAIAYILAFLAVSLIICLSWLFVPCCCFWRY